MAISSKHTLEDTLEDVQYIHRVHVYNTQTTRRGIGCVVNLPSLPHLATDVRMGNGIRAIVSGYAEPTTPSCVNAAGAGLHATRPGMMPDSSSPAGTVHTVFSTQQLWMGSERRWDR